jgi:hypothetical protein
MPVVLITLGSLAAGCGASGDGATPAPAGDRAEAPEDGGAAGKGDAEESASSSEGSPDPCRLLGLEEVGQVLGLPMAQKSDKKLGAWICDYYPTDKKEKSRVHVLLTPVKDGLWEPLRDAKPAPDVAEGAESGESTMGQVIRFQRNGQGTIVVTERVVPAKATAIAKMVAARTA